MQSKNCESTKTQDWTLKNTLWTLGTMVLLCVLAIGFLWYPQHQKRQQAEAAQAVKVAADKKAKLQKVAIKAAMHGPPNKKMATVIQRGSSGQADFLAQNLGGFPSGWRVGTNQNPDDATVASNSATDGWGVTSGGVVTVPTSESEAPNGTYYAFHGTGVEADPGSYWVDMWEFQVVEGDPAPAVRRRSMIID